MARFIAIRLGLAVLVLWALATVVFLVAHVIGDPAALMSPINASPEYLAGVRAELGLDDPLIEQYWRYLTDVVTGDFGTSTWGHAPALDLVLDRMPATLALAAATLTVSVVIGLSLGIVAARHRGEPTDRVISILTVAGLSTPPYWLALMLILIFSVTLGLLPTSGYGSWQAIILPVAALAPRTIGRLSQMTRTSLGTEMTQPYMTTARSKGLSERRVVGVHALRNGLIPVFTVGGDELAALLGGSIVVESIFGWPGVGALTLQAMVQRDLPLVLACVIVIGALVVLTNLVVDIAYLYIDPRIRYA